MIRNNNKNYEDYVHQFAMWTACRAIQRGFLKTDVLVTIIENSKLKEKVNHLLSEEINEQSFDKWQKKMAEAIINKYTLSELKSVVIKNGMTYGRAAKMIAIYIKTSYVIRNPQSELARYAHPPVDKKLLLVLRKEFKSEFNNTTYKPWSHFDVVTYFETINILRSIQKKESMKYFWMLEKYWKP